MTPNKLPPLPKHASKGPWPGDPAFYTADQMLAYGKLCSAEAFQLYVDANEARIDAEKALRQSQSLPAGAVAGLAAQLRQMACWCKSSEDDDGTGTFIPAYASGDVFDILTQAALQADAREKGDSASLNQIPKPCKYPPVDSETGADTGSCCHHAYADGWNECRAEAILLATQPAQASEKDDKPRMLTPDELANLRETVAGWHAEATHPQPVTHAGGEVEPRTDRQMLLYLDYQFAGEHWVCGRCGNEEPTNGCDSHIALQRHLYTNPPVAVDDAMIDRATAAFLKDNLVQRIVDRVRMKAAIDAALNQRGGGDHG